MGADCHFRGFVAGIVSDEWKEECDREGDAHYNLAEWALVEAQRDMQADRDNVRERKFLRTFAYPLSALVDLGMQLTWVLRNFPNLLPFFIDEQGETIGKDRVEVDAQEAEPQQEQGTDSHQI